MYKKILFSFVLALFSVLGAKSQFSLYTSPPLAGGNGAGGVTFNLRANSSIFLDTIWVPLTGTVGSSTTLQLWYNTTPINGAPTVAAPAWTQIQAAFPAIIGNASSTSATGFVYSPIVIPNGLLMNAGDIFGFSAGIATGASGSFAYTGTTAIPAGIDTFTNGIITIYTGVNVGYGGPPPNPINTVRQFTGGVSYRVASGRDLRVSSILSPVTIGLGNNAVEIRIQNAALDPILSADLGYQLNSNAAVINSGVSFGPLSSGQTHNHTFSVPINIPATGSYTLRVWAVNSNGLGADNNVSNDTLVRNLCTAIGGTFTIGGAGANYATIADAVSALQNCGINSPVTFLINPGTYYGSHSISNIPGGGGANTVTFTSATGIASDVVLFHDTAASNGNRVQFSVSTSTKVTFSNLTFRRSIIPGSANGCITYGVNSTAEVLNCTFIDQVETQSTFNVGVLVNGGSGLITGNTFSGFYYGVFLNGPSTNPFVSGNQVFSNNFPRYIYRAIYALNQNDAIITNNNISGFASTSTAGAGIWAANGYNLTIASNKITGDMSVSGIILSNLNADTLNVTQNVSKIYNNVIAGSLSPTITSTLAVPALISVTGSFSATANPPNPRDAYEIVNNTVNYRVNTTSTSTFSGGLYFTGGTAALPAYAYVNVRNNHVEVNPVSGSLPAAFRLVRYTQTSIIDSLTSTHNNYRMGGATVPAFFRNNLTPTDYNTVLDWQTATGKDANSGAIDAVFISPTLPIPSSTGFDNRGTPISYVSADVDNNPRSTTTPDIGAYEFVGSVFSQIAVTLLSDTLLGPNRVLTVAITDSSSTITPNTARLFYKKSTQSLWVIDSLPSISGNNYSFVIDTLRLGGTRAMDTIQYYVAVRNATNTVTTAPLGGNGLYISNQTVPPSVFSYRILPIASGNYRVGTSGPAEFPTLTAAANFYSSAFMAGPVTFTLIDTSYTAATGETFPIVFVGRPTSTATFTTTIFPAANRSSILIEGNAPTTSGALVLRGVKWFTIDGSNNSTTSRNLTIRTNSTATTNAAVFIRSVPGDPANDVTLRNLNVVGGSTSITSTFGVMAQGLAPSTSGTADSLRNLTIDNISVARAYYAIYVRGNATNLSSNVNITNNSIGSLDTANFVIFRGIDVQNIVNANISRNTIFNLVSSTATTQAAIEVGGTALRNNRINRNLIWGIKNLNTGGWGAYGINVLSGDSVIIDNNVMYDIRTLNYSTTSQSFNPFGIRLTGGLAHRVHYNSVYLYGNLTNTNTTTGSSGAAFGIAAAAVTGDVRNNIFANTTSSVTAASMHNAIWVPAGYNFANLTLNNNAYHVDTIAQNAVGRIGTTGTGVAYTTVADWKLVSSVGNPNNDNLSVPPVARTIPPFVGLTNLTIPAGTTTGIESGAVAIAALGTPNTDFTGANRPGGTGTAPDMGAYEFNGVALPDIFPPTIDSARITPNSDQCITTARSVTVFARDNSGGRGIDSVWISYSIDSIMQPRIVLTRSSGTAANGVWTGTLPAAPAPARTIRAQVIARDSLANFSSSINLGTYKDDYIVVSAGNDTTILAGDSATLRSAVSFGANGFLGDPTLAATTNCAGGFMFDLRAVRGSLFITGFDLLPNNLGAQTVNVFYRIGGVAGFQANQAAWISAGSYNITTTSNSVPFFLPISGFTIPAGATVGVYLQYHSRYATGSTNLSNADLTITNGEGMCTNWTVCCSPRSWVGRVYYGSPITYSWRDMSGTTLGIGDSIVVRPTVTTSYILVATDSVCTKFDTVVVNVNPLIQNPDIGVSRIMSPVAGSSHNGSQPVQVTVMLKNYGPVAATGFDVEYRVNGGASIVTNSITSTIQPGDSLQHTFTVSWTPTTAGSTTLCANTTGMPNELVRSNDTACVSVNSTVSLEELALNNRLIGNVYPNPATTEVNFEFNEFSGNGTLEVLDQLGRVIAKVELNRNDQSTYTLKTEAWSAGLYSYRLTTATQIQTGKLVVRK